MVTFLRWFFAGLMISVGSVALIYLGAALQEDGKVKQVSSVVDSKVATAQDQTEEDRRAINDQLHRSRRNSITEAILVAEPAVVGITVTQVREYRAYNPMFEDPFFRQFFNIPERIYREKVENLGSGFIISDDGYVLTNEHVVHEANEIVVTMTGGVHKEGKRFEAKVVGTNYDFDIALLKIDGKNLPYLNIALEENPIVGEWVMAIGNPFGLFDINDQPSVSVGVVSAIGRDFERNEDGRQYRNMLQTDAAINPGNSGGPLINVLGEVIGMNTFIFSGKGGGSVGIGFAIPADILQANVDRLRGRGELQKDIYTGLIVQDIDRRIALSLGYPSTEGVLVTEIEKDSPADKSELEPVDIIYEIEGTSIKSVSTIKNYFRNRDLRVGDVLSGKYFRNGKEYKFMMELEAKPD
ncbi:trypsin-like peptidase domain-containing protein [bacterium]|nr:trypsin-like peptidase domain-containing protein [bacterium]